MVMKAKTLREQTPEEIRQACADAVRELGELRVKRASGEETERPMRKRTLRRDIARIRTIMRERGV